VVITSDLGNGDLDKIKVRASNANCGNGLANGYAISSINIARPAPSLLISATQNYLCNVGDQTSFSISGAPSGSTVTWSVSSPGAVSFVGGSTGTNVTISKTSATLGFVDVTATVTHCVFTYNTNTIRIALGTGRSTVFFTQKTVGCVLPNKPYFWGAVEEFTGVTSYDWYSKDMSNPSNPFVLRQSLNVNTGDFPLLKNRYYTIRVNAVTNCGVVSSIDGENIIYAPSCIGGVARIAITPNPASSTITVQPNKDITVNSNIKMDTFTAIEIRTKTGVLVMSKKITKATNLTNINISALKADVYVLSAWNGSEWISEEFIKQ
jgi:hypothetical protein